MALRQPIAVNKIEKPVIIFKNGSELKEFLPFKPLQNG